MSLIDMSLVDMHQQDMSLVDVSLVHEEMNCFPKLQALVYDILPTTIATCQPGARWLCASGKEVLFALLIAKTVR